MSSQVSWGFEINKQTINKSATHVIGLNWWSTVMNYRYRTLLMKVCKVVCWYDGTAEGFIKLDWHLQMCECDRGKMCHPALQRWPVASQRVALNLMFFWAADPFVLTQTDWAGRVRICVVLRVCAGTPIFVLTFSSGHASVQTEETRNPMWKSDIQE